MDLPLVVVDLVVAVVADQYQVVEVGGSVVGPPDDVMGSTPQWVRAASDAALISGDQGDPLRFAGGAQPAPQPHLLGLGVEDRRQNVAFER